MLLMWRNNTNISKLPKTKDKVLLLDSPIIAHLIQKLEGDKDKVAFTRVDGDAVENPHQKR